MNKFDQLADFFFDLRQTGKTADSVPAHLQDIDMAAGYATQDKLVAHLLAAHGGHKIGYKIGCTSKGAQELLNTNKPVYGQMISAWHHHSPVVLPASDFSMLVIEPEFAFTLAADVPQENYDVAKIRPFVANVIPSIEIVHHHLAGWHAFNANILAADNTIHGAWVAGETTMAWDDINFPDHQVTLYANDKVVSAGEGSVVLGNPLNALAWLANTLPQHGHQLKAGDIVTTGVCMPVYTAQPNEQLRADFGSLGQVEVLFQA